MGDCDSAELFAEMFRHLASTGDRAGARKLYARSLTFDFSLCEMDCDAALLQLDLARTDEQGTVQYLGQDFGEWPTTKLAEEREVVGAKYPTLMFEHRLPDNEGWWARMGRNKEIAWFFVERLNDPDSPLVVWSDDIEDFVSVKQYAKPLMRWAGPVTLDS